MATSETGLRIQLVRRFTAPRERVFRAFTEKEAVKVWFAGPVSLRWLEEPVLDLRPGGRYRFTVGDGQRVWTVHGSYLEVKPPERLKFTWLWEDDATRGDSGDTVVTVEFQDRGGETEVRLTHEGLPNEPARDEHAQGWGECFDSIEKIA